MNLVGISGQAHSGKDLVADKLVKSYGFTKMALADPFKRFGSRVFQFSDQQLWGPSQYRNEIDLRYASFNSPIWNKAQENVENYGRMFVGYVLGESDQKAFEKLKQWFEDLRANHTKLSPRIMLQMIGSEWGRAYKKDLWINCLINRASGWATPVVVSDIRFKNELEAIKRNGGKVIKLVRPETDGAAQDIGIKGHGSESEQLGFTDDQFDFILENTGTLDELFKKVDRIVNKLN